MGLAVQCACGNALEGENLDLVVTLSCPHCRRELTLELDDVTGTSKRPVLTVVRGPYWVGTQFVVPVGVDLSIGRGSSNWIVLEDPSISEVHCRVRLLPDSGLVLEDQKSATGTWVGPKRVSRGKLISSQPFRLGNFSFRLDLLPIDTTTAPQQPLDLRDDTPSVRFDVTRPEPALFRWFIRNRFQVSRLLILIGAWTMGVYHALAWLPGSKGWGHWSRLVLGAAAITGAMLASGSRVSLAHRQFKYASLAVLVLLAIIDSVFQFHSAAIAALCLAACLTILVMRVPTGVLAMLSVAVGTAGLIVVLVATIVRCVDLIGSRAGA
jgi:FHA domain-containing protein